MTGVLTVLTDARPGPSSDFGVWPPRDAVAELVEDVYERFSALGLAYGPVFQGLRGVWRRGDETFAEVAIPTEQEAATGGFGVHPALLDAALHAVIFSPVFGDGRVRLPFAWTGMSLWASGARELRVRMVPVDSHTVALELADPAGQLVAGVESLTLREVSGDLVQADGGLADGLFQIDWTKLPARQGPAPAPVGTALPGPEEPVPADVLVRVERPTGDEAEATHTATARVLALVREWLGVERFAGARLVVVTEGAVAPEGVGADPVLSAVWGVVRAARAEAPGRLVLLDVEGGEESWSVVGAALASGEPELAVRGGVVYVPRLGRVSGAGALTAPGGESVWRL
ncbi:polyketide synthase dehydratase domain-containing protein, partial [Streptomyces bungoensis]|uniref:polyketide synthase dehydratase domain-containing protein n=1 Tax=Streptomyces bungoensis TaxID=285568 RepID=UPI001FC96AD3